MNKASDCFPTSDLDITIGPFFCMMNNMSAYKFPVHSCSQICTMYQALMQTKENKAIWKVNKSLVCGEYKQSTNI